MTYLNPDNTATCPCDFCVIRRAMLHVMATIEDLPEFGAALLDDVVLDVYNAAQSKPPIRAGSYSNVG
jgi:hypothetical protein